jgi:hypothetical protein
MKKKILNLMNAVNKKRDFDISIEIYSDHSGLVFTNSISTYDFDFDSEEDLIKKLEELNKF